MALVFVCERLYTNMSNSIVSELVKRSLTGAILIIAFGGAYLHSSTLFSLLLVGVLLEILFLEWPKLISLNNVQGVLITLAFPIAPFAALLWLTNTYYATDIYLPLYPFLVCWTADSCGYLVGKLVGKHKIYPSISPGKSWQGLAGSIAGVFILNLLVLERIHHFSSSITATNLSVMFLFSAGLAALTLVGGFFMSYLKRKKNLKDTGNLLPGHGGFLDRFDSVLFVATAVALLTVFIK